MDRGRGAGVPNPGTMGIIVSVVAVFVLGWLLSGTSPNPVWSNLAYDPDLAKFWTLLTYPLASGPGNVLFFVIGLFILYMFAGSLERETGPWGIVSMFAAYTLLGGLAYFVGSLVSGGASAALPGLDLPASFVFVTWAARNRTATVMLMFVIPVKAFWLAVLVFAFVAIEYGNAVPLVGIVTAASLAIAWLYGSDKIPLMRFGRIPDLTPKRDIRRENKEFDSFMDDVKKREQEREEKERLRKLFENSLSDDEGKKGD